MKTVPVLTVVWLLLSPAGATKCDPACADPTPTCGAVRVKVGTTAAKTSHQCMLETVCKDFKMVAFAEGDSSTTANLKCCASSEDCAAAIKDLDGAAAPKADKNNLTCQSCKAAADCSTAECADTLTKCWNLTDPSPSLSKGCATQSLCDLSKEAQAVLQTAGGLPKAYACSDAVKAKSSARSPERSAALSLLWLGAVALAVV